MARLSRTSAVAAATLVAGITLAACGSTNGHAIAACHQVRTAIATYEAGQKLTGAARAAAIAHATGQLDTALGEAAAATSEDGSWNALMTTIGEAARVPIENLIPSLTAQCDQVLNPNPYAAQ